MAYPIYALRYPVDQIEPDPEKKTLVILGTPLPFQILSVH